MANTKTTALVELASGDAADADMLPIVDVSDTTQAASGSLKRFSWSSVKATLKSYFDTLYQTALVSGVSIRTINGNSLLGSADLVISGGGGAPGGSTTQVQYNSAGALAGDSGMAYDATTKVLTVGGATSSGLDILSTGHAFIRTVNKTAGKDLRIEGGPTIIFQIPSEIFSASQYGILLNANNNAMAFGWTTDIRIGTPDLAMYRDAADALAQRRGTNGQTSRTYGTYTDGSNYRRVALAMTSAGVATLKPEGGGTGASGNVLHISGLPTSNPGAGILWNNAGAVAIGT